MCKSPDAPLPSRYYGHCPLDCVNPRGACVRPAISALKITATRPGAPPSAGELSRRAADHAEEADRIMAPSAPHRMDRRILCEFSLDRIYRMNRIWRKRRILPSRQSCHPVKILLLCGLCALRGETLRAFASSRENMESDFCHENERCAAKIFMVPR